MRIGFRVFLSISIIYCVFKCFVCGNDYTDEHLFKVKEDLKLVEDHIIKYTKDKRSFYKGEVLNTFLGVKFHIR